MLLSSIVVSQTELAKAFKSLRKFIRRKQDVQVIFTFADDSLTLDVPGIQTKVAGKGSLTGQAYVGWDYLNCVAAVPPTEDPVLIRVEAGYLIIGTTYLPCQWQETLSEIIKVPLDARLLDILGLPLKYKEEEIAKSGLTAQVWDAERRMYDLVKQATALLKPLGVEYSQVLQIVEDSLKRKKQIE